MDALTKECFIDQTRQIVRFQPEMVVAHAPYDKARWSGVFAQKKGVDPKKLLLSNIGLYSATKIHVSKLVVTELRNVLNSWFPRQKLSAQVITETNGGLGTLSIALAPHVLRVNAVEIVPTHQNIIAHNTSAYGLSKKINVVKGDYLDVGINLTQDIIVSDPAWGGLDYKKHTALRLGLDNVDIVCFINHLYEQKKFKLFVLLAPYNFDMISFIRMSRFNTMTIRKAGGLYIIFIKGAMSKKPMKKKATARHRIKGR
jgi:predicted RNA methylase